MRTHTHTHTHASVEICFTYEGTCRWLFGGCPVFFFPGTTTRRGRFLEWACKRWLQNFMPVSFSSFLFSFLLPSILFITIINNTKLHSGNPHCLQKNWQHWGEKGEREKVLPPRKAADSTTRQPVKTKILSSFFFCGPYRQDPLGSSAHHIPAVYCKSNEKITIKIGTY